MFWELTGAQVPLESTASGRVSERTSGPTAILVIASTSGSPSHRPALIRTSAGAVLSRAESGTRCWYGYPRGYTWSGWTSSSSQGFHQPEALSTV